MPAMSWKSGPGTHCELAAANDAFMAEIVEHKRTAKALRDSQTKFQAIFETSIDAIGLSKEGFTSWSTPRI